MLWHALSPQHSSRKRDKGTLEAKQRVADRLLVSVSASAREDAQISPLAAMVGTLAERDNEAPSVVGTETFKSGNDGLRGKCLAGLLDAFHEHFGGNASF